MVSKKAVAGCKILTGICHRPFPSGVVMTQSHPRTFTYHKFSNHIFRRHEINLKITSSIVVRISMPKSSGLRLTIPVVVVIIRACHARDPGSIPGWGAIISFFFLLWTLDVRILKCFLLVEIVFTAWAKSVIAEMALMYDWREQLVSMVVWVLVSGPRSKLHMKK